MGEARRRVIVQNGLAAASRALPPISSWTCTSDVAAARRRVAVNGGRPPHMTASYVDRFEDLDTIDVPDGRPPHMTVTHAHRFEATSTS